MLNWLKKSLNTIKTVINPNQNNIIFLDLKKQNFLQLKYLPKIMPKLLWDCDYWDGALTGICSYKNKKHWFEIIGEFPYYNEDGNEYFGRIYAILELNSKQIKHETYWHNLFRKYVGYHSDYNLRQKKYKKHETSWSTYYSLKKNKEPRNYNHNKVVAWWSNPYLNKEDIINNMCPWPSE